MNHFFWSKNFLNYVVDKKIQAKYVYSKYLIRNIDINSSKFLYLDNYSNINIKFLNTDYALLWTQTLMNIGSSYIGYHKIYKFYQYDFETVAHIHWRKLNFNYASRLLKQCSFLIRDKKEYIYNCLILQIKRGGFWCVYKNILFFIRKKKMKLFNKKYIFNKYFIMYKSTTKENLKKLYQIYIISNLLKLGIKKDKRLFLKLYRKGSFKNKNLLFKKKLKSFWIVPHFKSNNIELFLFLQLFCFNVDLFNLLGKSINLIGNPLFSHIKKKNLMLANSKMNNKYAISTNKIYLKKKIKKLNKNFLLQFYFKKGFIKKYHKKTTIFNYFTKKLSKYHNKNKPIKLKKKKRCKLYQLI